MINQMLDILKTKYTLNKIDVGDFSVIKANGMTFNITAYRAAGLGHISIMQAKGFFGLMKMDTLIIVPREIDMPLYSYDRIFAMGNDTLIVELYDTFINNADLSDMEKAKEHYSHLPERDPGIHWYDEIKLPQSISKKGKKNHTEDLNCLALKHFNTYLDGKYENVSNTEHKNILSSKYVNGLLEKGGPSTDVFKKSIGTEKTSKLFKKFLFGTEESC